MIIVADAGPLVHLHWVGAADWALPMGEIRVVDAVWVEVERHDPAILLRPNLVRIGSPTIVSRQRVTDFALDPGETDAIAHALSLPEPALVLCDERAARRACVELRLAVVGSIGLIVEACRSLRTERAVAIEALAALPTRGRMHVTRDLVERAIAAL